MIEYPKSCVRCRCSKISVNQRKVVTIECSNCHLMVMRRNYQEAVKAWNAYTLDRFVISTDKAETTIKEKSPDGT